MYLDACTVKEVAEKLSEHLLNTFQSDAEDFPPETGF